ncbi:T9SS type A sorting domain-containing protein [Putridiphycobacter roseus]|uniref:T9SS type A sorting domain-containing protein n=1 Tax=Putridiphycobacter roseus TaxID=2219161 RepID=UPI0011B4641C|nr:T9SS type A sorting domain-containing protein [Putridiphycobacter roseus]
MTLLVISNFGFSQVLTIDSLTHVKPICRTLSFQTGFGSLSVHMSGGSAPYMYLWEKLGTTQSNTSQTWSSLEPGEFKITVTDNVGSMVVDTIQLDSVNPVAAFNVVSTGLTLSGNNFTGVPPVYVEFYNQSYNFTSENQAGLDTIFFWKLSQTSQGFYNFSVFEVVDTIYDNIGSWEVSMWTKNVNDCRDTTSSLIILGTAGIDVINSEDFQLRPIGNSQIKIIASNNSQNEIIRIFNLSGVLVYNGLLKNSESIINLNLSKQLYVFEILNAKGTGSLSKGKFVLR